MRLPIQITPVNIIMSKTTECVFTHFGPADMTGHDSAVQNSVIVPYNMLI